MDFLTVIGVMALLLILIISFNKYIVRSGNIKLYRIVMNVFIFLLAISAYGNFREGDILDYVIALCCTMSFMIGKLFKLTECEIQEYSLRKKFNSKSIYVSYYPWKKRIIVKTNDVDLFNKMTDGKTGTLTDES